MNRALAVCAVVAVGACKSKSNDAPTPPSPASSATTTASASTTTMSKPTTTAPTIASAPTNAGPRPRYLRRVHPDKITASSVYDDKKTHEKHPAIDAFDGNVETEWAEGVDGDGKGEWIEASFTKPRAIWGIVADTGIVITRKQLGDVFPLDAHAKRLRLVIDGADAFERDVAADEPQIAWNGIAREVSTLRFVADDVWPGSKWHDFGITEIALLADASTFPSVPESIVKGEVDAVDGAEAAAALLKRFGVNPPAAMIDQRPAKATLLEAALIDDKPRERVLVVSIFGGTDANNQGPEDDFVVFCATTEDDRLIGLGSDWISTETTIDQRVSFTTSKLHSSTVDDVVAKWFSGMRAWTMERGFVERLVGATVSAGIGDEPAPPHTVTTMDDMTLKFDPRSYRYR